MKIVSIDIGTRNLGLAVYKNGTLTHFNCYCLFDYVSKKKERTDYSLMTYNFIQAHPEIFKNMDKLLLENQMQSKMKVIQTSFRCFFYKKAVKISPLAVHNHFKSGKGKHSKNKKAAIKLVEQFLSGSQLVKLKKHPKTDDISDAIIQIYYYIQKHFK
jgi:hypothetical protein